MEVYRNSTNVRVTFTAPEDISPVDDNILVQAVNGQGQVLHDFTQVYAVEDGYAVELPWSLTREDSDFIVKWKFDYVENGVTLTVEDTSSVEVITPVLPFWEVKKISGLQDDYDIIDLERRVRFSIQTYTATTFGKFKGTIPVMGNGDAKLQLPLPILRVDAPVGLHVYGGGWMLGPQTGYYTGGIKSCPPDEILDQFSTSAGPIVAPYNYKRFWFADDVSYNISGIWGYNDVPENIRQAARLLIADYACDESLWRDRYLNSIKAGDWRIDFNAAAFTGTGNVSADQILAAYRRTNLVAI